MSYQNSIYELVKENPVREGCYLITGATGLIGSCIIDALIYSRKYYKANIKILALSRSADRITNRFGNDVIPVVQDICMPLELEDKIDYIIHLASNADPQLYATQPVETVLTNIIGNRNILDYCKNHPDTKILLASTFEVYGIIEGAEMYKEDMVGIIDFQVLRNGYPESKRCAEILLRSYVEEYGVKGVIARLASIYGPTMLKNDSKAHAQFIKNALNGEKIVLKSEGLQKRTYCYVIDAVSALFAVLFNGKNGEVYNISNEKSISSIIDVARTVATISGAEIVFDLPTEAEQKGFSKPQNCVLDNSKLKMLGWNGKYTLLEGMRETIETLMANNDVNNN